MSHTNTAQVAQIAAQIGSSLEPDNRDYTNRFRVASTSSSSVYLVSQRRATGQWCCSCRGWIHHRKCKHLTDILARLAALPAAARQLDAGVMDMLQSARTSFLDLYEADPVRIRKQTGLDARLLDL